MVTRRRRRITRRFIVSWPVNHTTISFSFYMFLLCSSLLFCSATDTITFNNSITDDERGETLVSAGERFELGFFTPNGGSSSARYVGIWYYKSEPQTVVWVANRDKPLVSNIGAASFAIKEDGNLVVLDGERNLYWSTNLTNPSSFRNTAQLLDSGNLVLIDGSRPSGEIVWESFQYPTDTFLPGMKMDERLVLTSWRSPDDPARGNFTFQMDQENQFIILNKLVPYWRSRESDKLFPSDRLPTPVANLLSNSSESHECKKVNTSLQCSPSLNNRSASLVMSYSGQIKYLSWFQPRDNCSVSKACGKFGSCNINNGLILCKCLPGFKPSSSEKWNLEHFSDGCIRKSAICGKNDTFLSLKTMKVGNADAKIEADSEIVCRNVCYKDCNCQAYSYEAARNSMQRGAGLCWIWTDDLNNLQEEYADGGRNLSVRVPVSDISNFLPLSLF